MAVDQGLVTPQVAVDKVPVATDRAKISVVFEVNGEMIDVSDLCTRFDFSATVNGGYVAAGRLHNAGFNVLRRLFLESAYFELARSRAVACHFKIGWVNSDNATAGQVAFVSALRPAGGSADAADVDFVCQDPASWYLNIGKASGKVYRGRVSDVIRQCVAEYAPGVVLDVSETTDSAHNRFWMMRLDPRSFITSILDWSAALTASRTQWLVAMDGLNLLVKEQAAQASRNVGFYAGPHAGQLAPVIRQWEVLADNVVSTVATKVVTQGASATTGQYFDLASDAAEATVVARDGTTSEKYKARVGLDRAFSRPDDSPGQAGFNESNLVGFTAVGGVPEVYSAGEIGRPYADYIGGRPLGLWLGLAGASLRCRFRVVGHGVFRSSVGLGVDTVTVRWLDVEHRPFFVSGNWIVYGFRHLWRGGSWSTDVYCARLDYDAAGRSVPAV